MKMYILQGPALRWAGPFDFKVLAAIKIGKGAFAGTFSFYKDFDIM